MIRHQKFKQSFPREQYFLGIRHYPHARLDRPHARRRKHTRPRIHHAKPANPRRRFILQMAKRRNRRPIHPRRIKHTSPRSHLHRSPVNRDLHKSRRCTRRTHNPRSFFSSNFFLLFSLLLCVLCVSAPLCVKSFSFSFSFSFLPHFITSLLLYFITSIL